MQLADTIILVRYEPIDVGAVPLALFPEHTSQALRASARPVPFSAYISSASFGSPAPPAGSSLRVDGAVREPPVCPIVAITERRMGRLFSPVPDLLTLRLAPSRR
jgi:hypothetical protein